MRRERGRGSATIRARLAAAVLACVGPCVALAADYPAARVETPLLDPYVPPAARPHAVAPPTTGATLDAQVEAKLARAFVAADVSRSGSLTREQARAAGLGYVVRHFDAIDRSRSGTVRFDDVKRFLRERGAKLN